MHVNSSVPRILSFFRCLAEQKRSVQSTGSIQFEMCGWTNIGEKGKEWKKRQIKSNHTSMSLSTLSKRVVTFHFNQKKIKGAQTSISAASETRNVCGQCEKCVLCFDILTRAGFFFKWGIEKKQPDCRERQTTKRIRGRPTEAGNLYNNRNNAWKIDSQMRAWMRVWELQQLIQFTVAFLCVCAMNTIKVRKKPKKNSAKSWTDHECNHSRK